MTSSPLLKFWLALVVIALAIHLGDFPLLDADEGRNAAVGQEMAQRNDYVIPRLNGLPYLDKPVVYFAAEAVAMEVLGETELAARLPAYLFTLATAAVLFWFARRIGLDPYVTAIVFLAMPLTVAFARTVIFDSALTFFVVVALVTYYIAIEEQDKRWSILAWTAMGFAMITKGPVTFLLVLFVAIPFAWRRKALRVLFPVLGIVAFVIVVAPWVWAMSRVVPEFLEYVLVTETAARMATKALKRTGPPWYFVPYLIGGALPWSIVALFSWKKVAAGFSRLHAQAEARATLFYALLWLVVPFVFFSISQSKRPQYILPLMPAVALLVARIWEEAKTRAASIVLAVFGAILLVAPLAFHRTKMKPEIAGVADETAIALGLSFALAAALALIFARRRDVVLVALTIPVIAMPLVTNPLMQTLGERRSTKSFIARLEPHLQPSTQVIGVEAFTGSMIFYHGKPMTIVTEDASELTSNYLIRRYEKFTESPRSPLKRLPYFEQSLGCNCVYILRNNDAPRRALLESRGWRIVAAGTHHVAYKRGT